MATPLQFYTSTRPNFPRGCGAPIDRILAFVRQQAQNGTGALTVKSGGTLEISSGTMTFDSLTVGR